MSSSLHSGHLGSIEDAVGQITHQHRTVKSLLEAPMTVENLRSAFAVAAGAKSLEKVSPPAFIEIQQGVQSGSMDDETAKQRLLELLADTHGKIEAIQ